MVYILFYYTGNDWQVDSVYQNYDEALMHQIEVLPVKTRIEEHRLIY